MNEEQKEKVVQAISNEIFNSLNINGLIESAKFYSITLANQRYEEISEEDRVRILEESQSQENAQKD